MPEYFCNSTCRSIFALKTMEAKRNFKKITQEIRDEILSLGYGHIKLNKDTENLWIDDYENYLSTSIHVDAIKINYDVISLCEDGKDILTFDHIYSIDRQIQIYETIYEHQDQLCYYQLDWNNYFKALAVEDENGRFIWRILTPDEARHLWYNGKGGELCEIYDDDSEGMIENEERLNKCINEGCDIGISVY